MAVDSKVLSSYLEGLGLIPHAGQPPFTYQKCQNLILTQYFPVTGVAGLEWK